MKSRIWILGMVLAALVWGSPAHATEFSADMISHGSGQTIQARIFVKDQKSRMEMPQMLMINRSDLGVAWMVMPAQGMYMEHPIDPKISAQTSRDVDGEISREPMGKETVNGTLTEKFKVTYSTAGATQSMVQWIGPQNIPVKVEAIDGSWGVEYRNIQTSGVSDELFELPAGVQKMQMPSVDGWQK